MGICHIWKDVASLIGINANIIFSYITAGGTRLTFLCQCQWESFFHILINCFVVVWKQKMVNNRKKSVVHIYEVGYHGVENRNGKTYIFLKRGKIPFFAFKIFLCLVILIKMRLRMMLMMMRMMAVMTNTYILIFSS